MRVVMWSLTVCLSILTSACRGFVQPLQQIDDSHMLGCTEKIPDVQVFDRIIRRNNVVIKLSQTLKLKSLYISPCWVNDELIVVLNYDFPTEFSKHGYVYTDRLQLAYLKSEKLTWSYPILVTPQVESAAVISYFKIRVEAIETNARVEEFIEKARFKPSVPISLMDGNVQLGVSELSAYITFNFLLNSVSEFVLPNNITWKTYPEIEHAHEGIKLVLLNGKYAHCVIGKNGLHNYTSGGYPSSQSDPWTIRVALVCGEAWKSATVQVNRDGTYERVKFEDQS